MFVSKDMAEVPGKSWGSTRRTARPLVGRDRGNGRQPGIHENLRVVCNLALLGIFYTGQEVSL